MENRKTCVTNSISEFNSNFTTKKIFAVQTSYWKY
jgi:hypothetical protein